MTETASTFYSWLALIVFLTAVGLAVWDTWRNTRSDDEWVDEEDPRRTPNWRRI